jgi:hypothetical protein
MSWDLSSEEVICNKLESQQTVIFAFSKKIKKLEEQLEKAESEVVLRGEHYNWLKAQNEIMSKDLDQAGNKLFIQEGKIKELEANLHGAITAMDEFVNDANDDELDTSDTLEHHAMMTRRALEKIGAK